jgi:hypothetical protein
VRRGGTGRTRERSAPLGYDPSVGAGPSSLAVGLRGGFVLANVIGGSHEHRFPLSRHKRRDRLVPNATVRDRCYRLIQSALVGVVATQVANTPTEVVPGVQGATCSARRRRASSQRRFGDTLSGEGDSNADYTGSQRFSGPVFFP